MAMKNILLVIAIFGSAVSSYAQQLPISSLYQNNRMLFNAANTGDQDDAMLQLNHKQQWAGIKGAPTVQLLTLQTALNDYMGIGGMIKNTSSDIMRQTSAHLNYSYGVDVALGHRLTFGLGAVYYQNSLDLNSIIVEDPSELSLYNANLNGSALNFDFGIRYNWDALEVGISANQLRNNKLNGFAPGDGRFNQFRTHYNFLASYNYEVNSDFTISPIVLVRYINQVGVINDYMVGVNYKGLVWGNIGYRDGSNFIFSAGTWLTNSVGFNYAYNYSNTLLALESFGTHEINISIKLSGSKEGPYKGKVEDGALTEKEKAIIGEKEKNRTKKDAERLIKEAEKKSKYKTIKIKTDAFDADAEIIIKPSKPSNVNSQDLSSELDLINKKLDLLLNTDFKDDDIRYGVEDEIIKLRKQLLVLKSRNESENVDDIADEVKHIMKKIEVLRVKLEQQ